MEEALAVVLLLLLSSTLVASDYCVCKSDQPTASLQKTIDYACGQGADCTAIQVNGGCYNPNTVAAHCSWAANSYYQKYKSSGATCDFTGAATVSSTDPSYSGCTFPASASAGGTATVGGTTGTTPSTFSPGISTGTGTNGTSTGFGSLGPTGTSSMDGSGVAAGLLPGLELAALIAVLLSFLAFP